MTKYDPNSMMKAFKIVYGRMTELCHKYNYDIEDTRYIFDTDVTKLALLVDTLYDELADAIDTLEVMVDD